MPLKIDNAVNAELERLAADDTRDSLEATVDQDSATVAINRTWQNGWNIAAYARAWWKGDTRVEAGVKVRKDF